MRITRSKFINFWFPVILYSGIIFYASSIPRIEIPAAIPFFDKLLHIAEYSILGFLFLRAVNSDGNRYPKVQMVLFALMFCFFYGVTDEYHQLFVPGRIASFYDIIADAIGGAVGGFIYTARKKFDQKLI